MDNDTIIFTDEPVPRAVVRSLTPGEVMDRMGIPREGNRDGYVIKAIIESGMMIVGVSSKLLEESDG